MKISLQFGTMQMVLFFTDWILVGKILVVQNVCAWPDTKFFGGILLLAKVLCSCVLTVV